MTQCQIVLEVMLVQRKNTLVVRTLVVCVDANYEFSI